MDSARLGIDSWAPETLTNSGSGGKVYLYSHSITAYNYQNYLTMRTLSELRVYLCSYVQCTLMVIFPTSVWLLFLR